MRIKLSNAHNEFINVFLTSNVETGLADAIRQNLATGDLAGPLTRIDKIIEEAKASKGLQKGQFLADIVNFFWWSDSIIKRDWSSIYDRNYCAIEINELDRLKNGNLKTRTITL